MNHQELFLNKYNPNKSVSVALSSAIKSALQHNSLYARDANEQSKIHVRNAWKNFLQSLVQNYKNSCSESEYEENIKELKEYMNKNFSNVFTNTSHPRFHTAPGFRISHAQKSISVFLKHLWCMKEVAMPPQCPVDRIVLIRANCKYPNTNWGYVNAIETHRDKIAILKKAANNLPLAEWELSEFNQQN